MRFGVVVVIVVVVVVRMGWKLGGDFACCAARAMLASIDVFGRSDKSAHERRKRQPAGGKEENMLRGRYCNRIILRTSTSALP